MALYLPARVIYRDFFGLESLKRALNTKVSSWATLLKIKFRLELSQMMANYDFDSLLLMYTLLNRVDDGVQPIIKELENHILSRGKLGLKNTNLNDGESLVTFMIDYMAKQTRLIDTAFMSDTRFTTARDKVTI